MLLLLTCSCTSKQNSYEININDSLIEGLDSKEKRSLLKDVSQAIDSVTTYFNVSFEETLYVYVFEGGHAEASSNSIYMPKCFIFHKGLIIHEVTHAVLKMKASSFEQEGLAVFMELKFGYLDSKQINN